MAFSSREPILPDKKKGASYKLDKQRESWQSSLYEKQKTQLTDRCVYYINPAKSH